MDTQFLETFVCVIEHGSMAEASRRLGITPAAVAQRLKALETDVGVPLIVRAGRQVTSTGAGAALLGPAKRILSDVAELQFQARTDQLAGKLSVGCVSTALTGMLPRTLIKLRKAAPQLELVIVPGSSPNLFDQIKAGELDAAIIVQPPFVIPKSMLWRTVHREPLALLASKELSGRAVEDLLITQPFLRYSRNSWGGRLVDSYLRQTGIAPREFVELDALEAIAVMADQGLGVGIVPKWLGPWPDTPNIEVTVLNDLTLRRSVGLLWRRGSPRDALIQALLKSSET